MPYTHRTAKGVHTHPRVTQVVSKVLAKPALVDWAAGEAVRAMERGEPDPQRAHSRTARASAERGTMIHAYASSLLKGTQPSHIPDMGSWCAAVDEAWGSLQAGGWSAVAVEQGLVDCDARWAGTADAVLYNSRTDQTAVLDWKTAKRISNPYPEHWMQLAAYASMRERLDHAGYSSPIPWPQPDLLIVVQLCPPRQKIHAQALDLHLELHAVRTLYRWLS